LRRISLGMDIPLKSVVMQRHGQTSAAMGLMAMSAAIFALRSSQSYTRDPRHSGPVALTFVMGPSIAGHAMPTGPRLVDTASTKSTFVDSSVGYALTMVIVAGTVATAARLATSVIMHAKKHDTWKAKQWRNADYLRRNPPPLLTKRELRKRVTKVKLMRREDEWACEFPLYIDPRDKKYQWSVEKVKQMQNIPEFKSMERIREEAGCAMPPFRMCDAALQEMRVRGSKAGTAEEEKPVSAARGKRQQSRGIDLSNINMEFARFKGLKLTKKQEMRLQQGGGRR